MDNATFWILYIISGSVGLAYFVYGKKQKKLIVMIAGIGLCVYPYFVSNPYLLVGIGVILVILPFLIKE